MTLQYQSLPTEREYHLKALVLVREKDILQERLNGEKTQIQVTMVYLLPQESSQRDYFYAAWLPEVDEEDAEKYGGQSHYEIGLRVGSPVVGFARTSFHRATRDLPEPHFFVMSLGASKDLERFNGRTVEITVLPENTDEILDTAKDFDLANQGERQAINDSLKNSSIPETI